MRQIDGLIVNKPFRCSFDEHRLAATRIDTGILSTCSFYKSSVNEIYTGNYEDVDFSMEKFYQLTQLNCYYCGIEPLNMKKPSKKMLESSQKLGTYIYHGLDRIDSDLPHTYSNCITSCKYCNYAKRSITLKDFDAWIDRLEQHRETLRNI